MLSVYLKKNRIPKSRLECKKSFNMRVPQPTSQAKTIVYISLHSEKYWITKCFPVYKDNFKILEKL